VVESSLCGGGWEVTGKYIGVVELLA
jgi:hypothetical protein